MCDMADMNIRNVPDELLAEVKRAALDAGKTLRDYVLAKLAEPGRGYVVPRRKAKAGDITVETLQHGYAQDKRRRDRRGPVSRVERIVDAVGVSAVPGIFPDGHVFAGQAMCSKPVDGGSCRMLAGHGGACRP